MEIQTWSNNLRCSTINICYCQMTTVESQDQDFVTKNCVDALTSSVVTVIMPAYNAAETIEAAIGSILGQALESFELLVGDDASTDATAKLVDSITDPRVRLIRNPSNLGSGPTRDRLMREANGQWIAFCDADDMWTPERLASLMEATGGNNHTIVFDDIMECHSTKSGMVSWRRLRGPHAFGANGKPQHVSAERLINSKSMLIKPLFPRVLLLASHAYHSRHSFGEDIFFLLKLLKLSVHLTYVPHAHYLYRITPGSASANVKRYSLLREILKNAVLDFRDQPKIQAALKGKVNRVRRQEIYHAFVSALKERRARDAVCLLWLRPILFSEFILRALSDVPYHWHRLRHGGFTRGSK